MERIVDQILKIFMAKNMEIKHSKFVISQQVSFGGCLLTASAKNDSVQIPPCPSKVEEILGKDAPKTRREAQSLVGSINQMTAWCPLKKRNTPLLRRLTGASKFEWTQSHQLEFVNIKKHIGKYIKLTPFNTSQCVYIHTDASCVGLGYLISQPMEETKEGDDMYRTQRWFITSGRDPIQIFYI